MFKMSSQWVLVILFSVLSLVYSTPVPQDAALEKNVDTSSPRESDPVLFSNENQTVRGKLKNVNGVNVFVYEGSYYLLHPNGLWQLVTYVADENGYVVKKFELKIPTFSSINPKSIGSLLGR